MFIYFDLGNVLLNFDHDLMCRQMAEVVQAAGGSASPERVKEVLFQERDGHDALEWRYERGEVSTDDFYAEFCSAVGATPDRNQLATAAYSIFTANLSVRKIVGCLLAARHKLGLLSNTNELHWQYVSQGRDDLLIPSAFDALALSYELKCMKPDKRIFEQAAKLAGVSPQEIFYVDDIPGHVAAAREVGFDAVQYTTVPQLVKDLRQRGIEFNY
jgi:putative hydrolase of the HAD superfamily